MFFVFVFVLFCLFVFVFVFVFVFFAFHFVRVYQKRNSHRKKAKITLGKIGKSDVAPTSLHKVAQFFKGIRLKSFPYEMRAILCMKSHQQDFLVNRVVYVAMPMYIIMQCTTCKHNIRMNQLKFRKFFVCFLIF